MSGSAVAEAFAVLFAVAYLLLAVRQSVWCWPAAIVSVALSFIVFLSARLLMESALQVFYLVMAVYGWHQWIRGGSAGTGVRVHWWPARRHWAAVCSIVMLTLVFGWFLGSTSAALPFLDSFTTVSAIIATWMVAQKVIENWIYWFVIDSASIYLYADRELYLYAALFVGYLILIVIGFRAWLRELESAPPVPSREYSDT